ncbi:MAG: Asp-tRNA(Asn)/Glu-tRNA(Gln) amidotransferase subunit GatC [Candidatus Babeliales bacterium]|nr:Asp-tRNA(Asn)/Glu-tRNA(Gln) amidotransferase subunit GatC [Candidatus Babeliales bacterium]
MAKISKEDVLKIAHISHITIAENEVDALVNRLEQVLSYAARVQEIAGEVQVISSKNVNVLREDVAVPFDAQLILARAPETQEHYFVVPAILDSNK